MADFAAILRKNIEKLGDTTPELRAKVYEKAREALQRKLDAMDPAPPQAAIDRQYEKMSAAAAEVEAEFAPPPVADPLDDLDSLLNVETEAAEPAPAVEVEAAAEIVETPEPVASEPVAAEVEDAPPPQVEEEAPAAETDDDPLRAFLEENAEVLLEPTEALAEAEVKPLEPNTERIAEIKSRARANDERMALEAESAVVASVDDVGTIAVETIEPIGDEAPAAIAAAAVDKPSPAWGRLFGFGLIALLIGGGIYVASTVPQVRALLGLEDSVVVDDETGLPVRSVETTTVTAEETDTGTLQDGDVAVTIEGDSADTVVIGTGQDAGPKFTQRLTEDGREVDDGPAEGAPAPGEGTSVSDQTPGTATEEDVASAETGDAEATDNTPLLVGQRAIFYEERTGTEAGTAVPGSIIWTQVQESPGGDLPLEPAIRGEVNVPDLNLSMVLTVRRNGDVTFPASHIIEMFFAVPETFSGRGIGDVQRVTFKGTEQDPGTALIGIPAPIDTNIFLVALTDATAAIQTNTQLMRNENWIDIPMQYVSGRRALVTIEKGLPGERLFQEVFDFWDANPLPSSG
ncbi:MAG: hypothetical protein AAGG69_06450 [Pseudomonadota bacterium]